MWGYSYLPQLHEWTQYGLNRGLVAKINWLILWTQNGLLMDSLFDFDALRSPI